jgi:hypothetical protein
MEAEEEEDAEAVVKAIAENYISDGNEADGEDEDEDEDDPQSIVTQGPAEYAAVL